MRNFSGSRMRFPLADEFAVLLVEFSEDSWMVKSQLIQCFGKIEFCKYKFTSLGLSGTLFDDFEEKKLESLLPISTSKCHQIELFENNSFILDRVDGSFCFD